MLFSVFLIGADSVRVDVGSRSSAKPIAQDAGRAT
jgi:hypothetical protein